jgi:hypothetical protein
MSIWFDKIDGLAYTNGYRHYNYDTQSKKKRSLFSFFSLCRSVLTRQYKSYFSIFFTWIRGLEERYRTVGTVFSVAALAARRPAPVVGPSAAAKLIAAVVAAATAPAGLATVAPTGVSGSPVELRDHSRTRHRLIPPLLSPVPGPL